MPGSTTATDAQPPSTDAHTHIGVDSAFYLSGWLPYASSAQDLVEHLDRAGIDRAVCFPMPTPSAFDPGRFARDRNLELGPGRVPFDRENELLLGELERTGTHGRLLPFAMFDPGRHPSAQAERLRALGARLRGMKTQTTLLRSPIRALLDEAQELMDVAAELAVPVVIHTAVSPDDPWARAEDCLDVAAAYPHIRFSLAHSLRFDEPALRRAAELDNVWVDCSAHLLHCELAVLDAPPVAPAGRRVDADYRRPHEVLVAVHEILGGQYLWGSDSPFQSWCDDDFCSIYAYADEAAVLLELPDQVAGSMTRHAPHAWLQGAEKT